jgi:hypothetical protein
MGVEDPSIILEFSSAFLLILHTHFPLLLLFILFFLKDSFSLILQVLFAMLLLIQSQILCGYEGGNIFRIIFNY